MKYASIFCVIYSKVGIANNINFIVDSNENKNVILFSK